MSSTCLALHTSSTKQADNRVQIRIVKDTHADEKPNKKKKAHRGYAFIVFEREKDMRGNTAIDLSTHTPHQSGLATCCQIPTQQDCGPQACPVLKNPFPSNPTLPS